MNALIHITVLEVLIIRNQLLEVVKHLLFKVGLSSQSRRFVSITSQDRQRCSILVVTCQSQAILLDLVLHEVVFSITNYSKCQTVKESVTFTIWHHWVNSYLGYKQVESINIKLTSCYMNAGLAIDVF